MQRAVFGSLSEHFLLDISREHDKANVCSNRYIVLLLWPGTDILHHCLVHIALICLKTYKSEMSSLSSFELPQVLRP